MDDDAVILPGKFYLFINRTAGAASPATTQAAIDALNLEGDIGVSGAYKNYGHTSLANNAELARDAEEGEIKGSVQRRNLRKTPDQITWSITANGMQMTNDGFDYFFGIGDSSDEDVYHVQSNAATVEGAAFLVLVDGDERVGLHVPKVDVRGNGNVTIGVEDFLELPTKLTFLDASGAAGVMSWYRAGLGTPA